MSTQRTHGGFALISALWLILLLTIIATSLTYSNRMATQGLTALVNARQAFFVADGALQLVLANLLVREPAERILGDGETLTISIPGGTAELTITDENGKVDINLASENLLSRLLQALGLPMPDANALAAAIVDYRDEDDLKLLNGAEAIDYAMAGLDWGPRNGPFESVEELQQVYGMLPDTYRLLQPLVTIHSRQFGINPEVAELPVLLAVSTAPAQALEAYLQERRQSHKAGLPLPLFPGQESENLAYIRGITFGITSVGLSESGTEASITTVIRLRRTRTRSAVETLEWKPYSALPSSPEAYSSTTYSFNLPGNLRD